MSAFRKGCGVQASVFEICSQREIYTLTCNPAGAMIRHQCITIDTFTLVVVFNVDTQLTAHADILALVFVYDKTHQQVQHKLLLLLLKGKGSPCSITERRVPELIPVLGSQSTGDVSHKPGGRLPLLFARLTVTPATLKRAATNFAAW